MRKLSANLIYAAVAKIVPTFALYSSIYMSQNAVEESKLISVFLSVQTFAFIVVQPGYLKTLKYGETYLIEIFAWFCFCSAGFWLISQNSTVLELYLLIIACGVLSIVRSNIAAIGIRRSPWRLVRFEFLGASFASIIVLAMLSISGQALDVLPLIMAATLAVQVCFLVIYIKIEKRETFLNIHSGRIYSSIFNGLLFLTASGYSMIIMWDVSQYIISTNEKLSSAFALTFIARTLVGFASTGFSNFIVSSEKQYRKIPLLKIILAFTLTMSVIFASSLVIKVFPFTSGVTEIKHILILSLFFASIFLSSALNSMLFKQCTNLAALSGLCILLTYFSVKSITPASEIAALTITSFALLVFPVVLLTIRFKP